MHFCLFKNCKTLKKNRVLIICVTSFQLICVTWLTSANSISAWA